MAQIRLKVNGKAVVADVDRDTPLLWVLRDELRLTGTKFGCGMGVCGACTVLQGSDAVRSCQITAAEAAGKAFTTIEGLSNDGSHPCQRAWIAEDVSQCGYCQPGMIMATCALLRKTPRPADDDIDAALSDHICRCGSYPRIRKAVHRASLDGGSK